MEQQPPPSMQESMLRFFKNREKHTAITVADLEEWFALWNREERKPERTAQAKLLALADRGNQWAWRIEQEKDWCLSKQISADLRAQAKAIRVLVEAHAPVIDGVTEKAYRCTCGAPLPCGFLERAAEGLE